MNTIQNFCLQWSSNPLYKSYLLILPSITVRASHFFHFFFLHFLSHFHYLCSYSSFFVHKEYEKRFTFRFLHPHRYSCCSEANPLKLTDPSSYKVWFCWYVSLHAHLRCLIALSESLIIRSSPLGNRYIENWTVGGDSMIKEYFVRLTPDRQSKSGYLWNKVPLTEDEWVVSLKFRISGQVCSNLLRFLSTLGPNSLWRWLHLLLHPECLSPACMPPPDTIRHSSLSRARCSAPRIASRVSPSFSIPSRTLRYASNTRDWIP